MPSVSHVFKKMKVRNISFTVLQEMNGQIITIKIFFSLSVLDTVCLCCSKSWENVSDCIETSRQSCDLTRVFSNIYVYNFIRLISEELPELSGPLICDPLNDCQY